MTNGYKSNLAAPENLPNLDQFLLPLREGYISQFGISELKRDGRKATLLATTHKVGFGFEK